MNKVEDIYKALKGVEAKITDKVVGIGRATERLPGNIASMRRLSKQRKNVGAKIKALEGLLNQYGLLPHVEKAKNFEKVRLNAINDALLDVRKEIGKGTAGVAAGVGTAGLTIRGFKELKRREIKQ